MQRLRRRRRLAVVLSGGAARGAFQVGAIDCFARMGIVPDVLVGTSVGAINAAFWAMHPEPDVGEQLLRLWLRSNHSTLLPDGPLPMFGRLLQRHGHLTTQVGLVKALRSTFPDHVTIADAPVELAITATDPLRGDRVVIREGGILQAVLASTAVPGVWPAVIVAGRPLVDGGVVANCDLESAVDAGATDIVAVDLMNISERAEKPDMRTIVEQTVEISLRRQTELAISAFARAARTAVLRRGAGFAPRFDDLSQTQRLFREGQLAARSFVARHVDRHRKVRPGIFDAYARGATRRLQPEVTGLPA
jgi:NTE family protein